MIKGLYAAASGMQTMQVMADASANNVANIDTTGYKRSQPIFQGFYETFLDTTTRSKAMNIDKIPGGGVRLAGTVDDFTQGSFRETGNPLDVAIVGSGFFRVETPQGVAYTRNGHFMVNSKNELVTDSGFRVLAAGDAPIVLRGRDFSITESGAISADGTQAGQLDVVDFPRPYRFTRLGDNLFKATPEAERQMTQVDNPELNVGAIETSNVNVAKEMLDLLICFRAFEANQRAIRAIDQTLGRTVNDVGRV